MGYISEDDEEKYKLEIIEDPREFYTKYVEHCQAKKATVFGEERFKEDLKSVGLVSKQVREKDSTRRPYKYRGFVFDGITITEKNTGLPIFRPSINGGFKKYLNLKHDVIKAYRVDEDATEI